MDDYDKEIPFGDGVENREVDDDDEIEMRNLNPYDSSSRRGSEDTTYRSSHSKTYGETSFIEDTDEHTHLITKEEKEKRAKALAIKKDEENQNKAWAEIKRKFPKVDTTKFTAIIDEYDRVKVRLIRKGGKPALLFKPDGEVNKKLPETIINALGTPAEDIIDIICYAILGSQVDVRYSISGSQGSAIETQRQFLSMVEDAIRNPGISKSVQRFQLAIESAKVRLDLAISPGLWLLPSKMVVNTESVVGYNNKLKKATTFMRIGVNSDLNIPVRRSAPKHNLGSRAVKLPHSGVETPETKEKQVVKSDSDREFGDRESSEAAAGVTKEKQVPKSDSETGEAASETREASGTKTVSTSHETNLNVLIIVAGGLAWFLFR